MNMVNMWIITMITIAILDELLLWMRCRQLRREAREAMNRLIEFGSWIQDIDGLNNKSDAFTVFAFNDTGYEALPTEERRVLDQLDTRGRNDYVKDFIVLHKYDIGQLYDGLVLQSVSNKSLFVDQKNVTEARPEGIVTTFIDGVPITVEGIQASNGIIHVLERPQRPISNGTVLDFVYKQNTKFYNLTERLYQDYFYTVVAPLVWGQKMTFFMPSQQFMEKIPDRKLNALSGLNLAKVFQMHFIPGNVVFTEPVYNDQSFTNGNIQEQVTFHKDSAGGVYVKAGGVTAKIITGNIPVANGVIHVIDEMLGFVYKTAFEQINEDARVFSQLIMNASMETQRLFFQSSEVNMFIPVDSAFASIGNLVDVDIMNQSMIGMIVRLGMIRAGRLSVTQLGDGNYENRQRRMSWYNNTKLVIYKDKNEVWVNGGNVRARIIRPDVGVTNGGLQYIDRVLGVPTMDIPTLIYDDGHLLRSYSELKRLYLLSYLADPLYNHSAGPTQNDGQSWNSQSDTDSTVHTRHTSESLLCDERCSSNSTDDPARCKFTVFLPSSIAFEHFYNNTEYATNITQDLCRFRYVLRRHVIPHKVISLEGMLVSAGVHSYYADNGDEVMVRKETENGVRVEWGKQSARAIMWDLGATNGIVHIVDQILSDPGDETVDIGLTTSTLKSTSATKTLMSTSTTMSSMSAVSTTVPKISEPSVAVPIIG